MMEKTTFGCSVCGAEFTTRDELERHRGERHRQVAADAEGQPRDRHDEPQLDDGREVF